MFETAAVCGCRRITFLTTTVGDARSHDIAISPALIV